MFKLALAAIVTVLSVVTGPALASNVIVGGIEIAHPWSRPTPPSAAVAGGYLTLTNTGLESDRLVGISTPIAERVEIHRTTVESGIARMRPVNDLTIAAGTTVDFEKDQLHIMFIAPSRQLAKGDRFPVTLNFERAGRVEVEFYVEMQAADAQHSSGDGAR